MSFIIVTGMSGAGKSTALKMLEDAGYFCADNLPLALVDKFAVLANGTDQEYRGVALGLDVRSVRSELEVQELLSTLDREGIPFRILFLEADDAVLVKRYKETRRSHPLGRDGRTQDGIDRERQILAALRSRADALIDTSRMLTRDLRRQLERIVIEGQSFGNMYISIVSFGFKYGIPSDADLVFDVRFLPNPFYEDDLKLKTGQDGPVQQYVMKDGTGEAFEKKWFDLISFLLPYYIAEGKTQLVIAVGCTGGKHRSVTMALHLFDYLSKTEEYGIRIEHRDILR